MASQQINFRKSIASLGSDTETVQCPVDGIINQVVMHFPPGCSALVEVRFSVGAKNIVPQSGYIALDDTTQSFNAMQEVRLGDSLIVDWINHDNAFAHTVSVIANIEEKPRKLI